MGLYAEQLADYITGLSYDKLPVEVISKSKELFMDTLGVMVLGSQMVWSEKVFKFYRDQGGLQEADAVAKRVRLPASSAAFVNGTMAHGFDYDDDWAACHIACCVIPTALAIGQKVNATGREVIASIVIGYDVTIRLAQTLDGYHLYAMGFHPTSVCGTFGAVAAASRLLKLPKEKVAHAFGVAGSFPSGSLEWLSDGSMTKRFHGGKAAAEGVIAASLAQQGFTGPGSIFEGKDGVFKMFQAQGPHHLLVEELGQRFDILKTFIKWHPCCTSSATMVDAVLALKEESRLDPSNVEEIEVKIRKTSMYLVGEPLEEKQNPKNVLEAQMSGPYCIAAALIEGELFPNQFTPEKINDPGIRNLAKKVKTVWDPSLDLPGPPRPSPAIVNIKLSNGDILTKRIDYQKGTSVNPLSLEELESKFLLCAKEIVPGHQAKRLIHRIRSLEFLGDVNELGLGELR